MKIQIRSFRIGCWIRWSTREKLVKQPTVLLHGRVKRGAKLRPLCSLAWRTRRRRHLARGEDSNQTFTTICGFLLYQVLDCVTQYIWMTFEWCLWSIKVFTAGQLLITPNNVQWPQGISYSYIELFFHTYIFGVCIEFHLETRGYVLNTVQYCHSMARATFNKVVKILIKIKANLFEIFFPLHCHVFLREHLLSSFAQCLF